MARYDRNTPIRDILTSDPRAISIFEKHGLPCAGCMAADMETVSAVASMHDISVEALLQDLNQLEPLEGEGGSCDE